MSEMPVPGWVTDAKQEMFNAHGSIDYDKGGVEVRELRKLLDFSTLFAEFLERDNTIIVHLFPRSGGDDKYYPEKIQDDKRIPGRLELSFRNIKFPDNMEELIKQASDSVWMGNVAIESVAVLRYEDNADVEVDELSEVDTGSYVVQFQDTDSSSPAEEFVDKFCEELDKHLE